MVGHSAFEGCGAVGDDAVALHLPKAQAAVPGTPLDGLPGQDLHRAPPARVYLVVHLQQSRQSVTSHALLLMLLHSAVVR